MRTRRSILPSVSTETQDLAAKDEAISSPRKKQKRTPKIDKPDHHKNMAIVEKINQDQENINPNISREALDKLADAKSIFRRSADNTIDFYVGRQKERDTIQEFINNIQSKNKNGSLYIAGCPGCGKTALMAQILEKSKIVHTFLNCMTVEEPRQIFSKLVAKVFGKETTLKDSFECFKSNIDASKKPILLVLDEIDQLLTANGDILYKLFEIPFSSNNKISIIGIANSLDLTDRFLPRLKLKGLEPKILHFQSYKINEISDILKKRLEFVKDRIKVQDIALELCSRKVVAIGDVRKGLDFILQAIEKAEIKGKESVEVTVAHMVQVLNNSIQPNSSVFKIKSLNIQCKCVLVAFYRLQNKHITVENVLKEYEIVCKQIGTSGLSRSEFLDICSTLETTGIWSFQTKGSQFQKRIQLHVSTDDIKVACQKEKILESLFLNE
ncbi:P-loop containing nucleoside triphosphate hydrolase protein [Rozella allomycis CSF55]|uniref:Cell division control protein n=1 Tax=Rozella allomycis (strain CSF55) TaxID=988480 RepID=A0A075ASY3_ROZAC|nr:P-loop containing nucleoside triphosphate hydrolase domain-containing protein [Rozella allomycis CSF55]RKP18396.1 P-loop containing nucleoside triphosphate hydrolase protein [Rozella allomycis CSF55]|eukprot:EPZ31593.1 P-loop containing nucleoside triphosphate hydrolase domain-containing protein [Rozella allomycis CSF55]